jgi:hypothetical protein
MLFSRHIQMTILALRHRIHSRCDHSSGGLEAAEVVCGDFKNANPASGKILLIPEILVSGDE